jgi:hypothetical protein
VRRRCAQLLDASVPCISACSGPMWAHLVNAFSGIALRLRMDPEVEELKSADSESVDQVPCLKSPAFGIGNSRRVRYCRVRKFCENRQNEFDIGELSLQSVSPSNADLRLASVTHQRYQPYAAILQRTDLCAGRSAKIVPAATAFAVMIS